MNSSNRSEKVILNLDEIDFGFNQIDNHNGTSCGHAFLDHKNNLEVKKTDTVQLYIQGTGVFNNVTIITQGKISLLSEVKRSVKYDKYHTINSRKSDVVDDIEHVSEQGSVFQGSHMYLRRQLSNTAQVSFFKTVIECDLIEMDDNEKMNMECGGVNIDSSGAQLKPMEGNNG